MYLTLPSNSSLSFFPKNEAGHFITKLPQTLSFGDDYEVGLAELQFCNNYQNISNDQVWFEYEEDRYEPVEGGAKIKKRIKRIPIPSGLYETNTEFVNELNTLVIDELSENKFIAESQLKKIIAGELVKNEIITPSQLRMMIENEETKKTKKKKKKKSVPFKVKYNPYTKKVVLFHYYPRGELRLSEALTEILGMPKTTFSGLSSVEAVRIMDLDQRVKGIFVYSDLVQSRPVGDVVVPLLRTLPPVNKSKKTTHFLFEKPHYMPLARYQFDTAELLLTSDRGEPISFENGHTIATLHFRRKRLI